MSWKREHGVDYDVPPDIKQLVDRGLADDMSWHNDTCPRFGLEEPNVSIWVEHPDLNKREDITARYCVVEYIGEFDTPGEPFYTDDVNAAIRRYLDLTQTRRDNGKSLAPANPS